MAHILQRTILTENPATAIVHFYLESDGSADLVNEPLIDPNTDLDLVLPRELNSDTGLVKISRLAIVRAWYNLNGPVLVVGYDGTPGAVAVVLCAGDNATADFSQFGGLRDLTVSNKNVGVGGNIIIEGGNTATDFGGTIPTDAARDPKALLNNQPDKFTLDFPVNNVNTVQNPPSGGTGKLVLTTQGLTLPSLIGGGFANGTFIIEFQKYVA